MSLFTLDLLIIILKNKRKKEECLKTGVVGFEPTDDGVKVHCLTTWLHPISAWHLYMTILGKKKLKNITHF